MPASRRFRWSVPLATCLALAISCGRQSGDPPAASGSVEPGDRVTSQATAAEGVDVTVVGRVLDDATGEGVAGGYVIVLAPGISFGDWEKSPAEDVEELMAGAAVTDSLGRYAVADLPRGLDFTVVVAARDHAPAVFEGGLSVEPDDPPLTRIADVRLEPR
jgi:hypothetical protein